MSSWVEPEWDEGQRELVLASFEVQALTGRQGEWLPDALSDDADPTSYSGYRYVASAGRTNWAEKAYQDKLDSLKKAAGEDGNINGVIVSVERLDYPT